jgi:hypothetical protein
MTTTGLDAFTEHVRRDVAIHRGTLSLVDRGVVPCPDGHGFDVIIDAASSATAPTATPPSSSAGKSSPAGSTPRHTRPPRCPRARDEDLPSKPLPPVEDHRYAPSCLAIMGVASAQIWRITMRRTTQGRARVVAGAVAALAMCAALTAGGSPKGSHNDVLVAETTNADGSTTSSYADGSSFTFEAPETAPASTLGVSALATARQSRNWTATYSVSITSQYFHHDGGNITLAIGPFSDCGVAQTVYLLVATSWGGYTQTGKQSVGCGGDTVAWDSPAGNKKFEIQDPNTNDQYFPHDVAGTVYWND